MIRLLLVLVMNVAVVSSFRLGPGSYLSRGMIRSAQLTQLRAESEQRFNKLIDLESEKVVNNLTLAPGEKAVVCRCWKSSKFPLCDGSHVKYNKETGDNLGPAIIQASATTE
mmetsp:Transcript_16738/g.28383  ORF Transcript_16738/g.28383 Transcript_16738/m.28383 type:complete len:112 (-) Transcript_16738:122-457(-)